MPKDTIDLKTASKIADVSPEAVRLWCVRHRLGTLTRTGWRVHRKDFEAFNAARNLFRGAA